jgi:tetratricopeptide (TPR) repeat protein
MQHFRVSHFFYALVIATIVLLTANGGTDRANAQLTCRPGYVVTNDGYCIPRGDVYCGGGTSCNAGSICIAGNRCLSRESPRVCPNGRNYCDPGFICSNQNTCISIESGRVCSNGRTYCDPGFVCTNDDKCISQQSARVCSNGRNYCDPGFICTKDDKCISEKSSRVCSNGRDYCDQGYFCNKSNKCLSETASQQQVDICKNDDGKFSADEQLRGCTDAIESGRWSGADLEWAYVNRGNASYDKNDFDTAIADYNQAISLDPSDAIAYNNRGLAYKQKREYDRALTDFDKALSLNSRYANAYINRGSTWHDKGDLDRAIADYSSGLQYNPKDALAYRNRARAYMRKEDYDNAIADYSSKIRLEPDGESYRTRGDLYEKKKDYENAIADYTEAIRLNPKDVDAYYGRGNIYYYQKKDYDRAMADYKEGVRLAAAQADRDPMAILLDVLTKSTVVSIYLDRGDALFASKAFDRAIGVYNEALAYSPEALYPLLHRAYAYYQLGQYDQAVADFDAILKQLKDDDELRPTVLFGRGAAKLKKNDTSGDADIMTARSIVPDVAAELAKFDVGIDDIALERTKPPRQPLPCQLSDADYAALGNATTPMSREQADGLQGNDARNLCKARRLAEMLNGRTNAIKSEDYPKQLEKYVSKDELDRLNKIMEGLLAKSMDDLFKK